MTTRKSVAEAKRKPKAGCTVAEFAAHVGLSTKGANQLIERGIIKRQSRASYDLDACRLAYLEHLRSTAAGRGASGEGDASLSSARARLTAARAEQAELEIKKSRHEFVPIDLVMKGVTARVLITRDRLLNVPGEIADALVGRSRIEIMDALDDKIREVLDELAQPIRMKMLTTISTNSTLKERNPNAVPISKGNPTLDGG